jgi:hypothetical protein
MPNYLELCVCGEGGWGGGVRRVTTVVTVICVVFLGTPSVWFIG